MLMKPEQNYFIVHDHHGREFQHPCPHGSQNPPMPVHKAFSARPAAGKMEFFRPDFTNRPIRCMNL
jgi:hypothetical protein